MTQHFINQCKIQQLDGSWMVAQLQSVVRSQSQHWVEKLCFQVSAAQQKVSRAHSILSGVYQKLVKEKALAHVPLGTLYNSTLAETEKKKQTVHLIVLIFSLLLDRKLLQCGIHVQLVGLQLPQEGLSLRTHTHTCTHKPGMNNWTRAPTKPSYSCCTKAWLNRPNNTAILFSPLKLKQIKILMNQYRMEKLNKNTIIMMLKEKWGVKNYLQLQEGDVEKPVQIFQAKPIFHWGLSIVDVRWSHWSIKHKYY